MYYNFYFYYNFCLSTSNSISHNFHRIQKFIECENLIKKNLSKFYTSKKLAIYTYICVHKNRETEIGERDQRTRSKPWVTERSTMMIKESRWSGFFSGWRPGLKSKVDTRSIESEITLVFFFATVKLNSPGSSRREHACSRKDPWQGNDR